MGSQKNHTRFIAFWRSHARPTELARWHACMTNARTARDPAWRHAMLAKAGMHRRMISRKPTLSERAP